MIQIIFQEIWTLCSLKDLVHRYTNSFSNAVNYNSFSEVQPYIYPGSELYNEQQNTFQVPTIME